MHANLKPFLLPPRNTSYTCNLGAKMTWYAGKYWNAKIERIAAGTMPKSGDAATMPSIVYDMSISACQREKCNRKKVIWRPYYYKQKRTYRLRLELTHILLIKYILELQNQTLIVPSIAATSPLSNVRQIVLNNRNAKNTFGELLYATIGALPGIGQGGILD